MSDIEDAQDENADAPYMTTIAAPYDDEDEEQVDSPTEAAEAEKSAAKAAQDTETDVERREDPVEGEEGLTEDAAEAAIEARESGSNGEDEDEDDDAAATDADASNGNADSNGKSNAINYAAANGDFDDDSELSDLDEEQFRDFDGAAPDGGEPAVYNLPSFRKKKGTGEKKDRKVGRARRNSSSDDEDGKIYSDDEGARNNRRGGWQSKSKVPPRPTDPEELRKWELDRAMDAAIAPARKRKKRDEDDVIAAMDEEIVQLTEKMRLAAQADAEANAAKKVAQAKLKLLPEVQRILRSQALYDAILDNNMLVSMKHWLEPLPDRSLPALNIQKAMFDALQTLPIKTEHLRESGVGKVVLFYKKSKKPEDSIKNQANTLIAEWSRPIIRKSASHKTKKFRTVDYDGPTSVPRLTSSLSQSTPLETSAYKSKGGTSIPRGEKAYEVAPRSRELTMIAAKNDGGEAYRRLKNTLKDLGKKKLKKTTLSIEGRGIA